MQKQIQNLVNLLNDYHGLAQWLTAFIAGIALIYAVKEFFLKRRPYIDVEIGFTDNPNKTEGGWHFFAVLINKGTYPGIAQITKAELRIGDELYTTTFKTKMVLSPGQSIKSAHLGHIKKSGIQKVLGHEYRSNRVEIEIEASSGDLGSKNLKYLTKVIYEVDVAGDKPEFLLVEENFK